YNVKGNKINNAAPGVVFYYSRIVAPSASFTVNILQGASVAGFPLFGVQKGQVYLYDAACSRIAQGSESSPGQGAIAVSGVIPGATYIVAVKYTSGTVVGASVPSRPTVHYNFSTWVSGVLVDSDPDGLNLVFCKSPTATLSSAPGSGDLDSARELYRPWPNPFAQSSQIAYAAAEADERVDIGVYDLAGRRLRTLVQGAPGAGRHLVIWDGVGDDGARVKAGMYFVRFVIGDRPRMVRIVSLR
ncbi:MAG: hypothetical protein E6K78_12425, partial [Candidatus Eisenbacteria bacterium]